MSGSHRADKGAIHIIRTAVLKKAADIRRTKSIQFRVKKSSFFIYSLKINNVFFEMLKSSFLL